MISKDEVISFTHKPYIYVPSHTFNIFITYIDIKCWKNDLINSLSCKIIYNNSGKSETYNYLDFSTKVNHGIGRFCANIKGAFFYCPSEIIEKILKSNDCRIYRYIAHLNKINLSPENYFCSKHIRQIKECNLSVPGEALLDFVYHASKIEFPPEKLKNFYITSNNSEKQYACDFLTFKNEIGFTKIHHVLLNSAEFPHVYLNADLFNKDVKPLYSYKRCVVKQDWIDTIISSEMPDPLLNL